MAIDRRLRTKCSEQEKLLWRVGNMIFTADDMRNLHQHIIDNDRKIVERGRQALCDAKVADLVCRKLYVTAYEIMKRYNLMRNRKSINRLSTFLLPNLAL